MTAGPATEAGRRRRALVPPDSRLCPDCFEELQDSRSRRHRDPFLCCSRCGPRYSLARSLPFDRGATSMACFPLCPECDREFGDPADRRFRAAPICCPACGPQLWAQNAGGQRLDDGAAALELARAALAAGRILAFKDVGGFQLACAAGDEPAVLRLRQRKGRSKRPFAVMARDLETARRIARLRKTDEATLESPPAPILLAPRRPGPLVCEAVAPGLEDIGVQLPATALHHELFRGLPADCLAMTSGNPGGEPVCRRNREAQLRLAPVADLFLMHDRDIVRRADDSVLRSCPDGLVALRRSRGRVPLSLPLPIPAPQPILAVGGERQVTACFALDGEAFLSQHVGGLESAVARSFHLEALDGLEDLLQAKPEMIVVDSHPDAPGVRLGEQLARSKAAGVLRVQHHLAHLVAAAAEHGRFPDEKERIGGVILDGGGWGPDGADWGGEVLELDGKLRWRRGGHLETLPLVGGEAAEREPWRLAVAALVRSGLEDRLAELPVAFQVGPASRQAAVDLTGQSNWRLTTSAGRLFEAAGALFGLCARSAYEGETAQRFESLAAQTDGELAPWPEIEIGPRGGSFTLPSTALLRMAAERLLGGEPAAQVAAGFHDAFCRLLARLTRRALSPEVRTIAVGGGCLVNRLLRQGLRARLESFGYEVLMATEVPPGDGGLSFGQAALAAAALARGAEPRLMRANG